MKKLLFYVLVLCLLIAGQALFFNDAVKLAFTHTAMKGKQQWKSLNMVKPLPNGGFLTLSNFASELTAVNEAGDLMYHYQFPKGVVVLDMAVKTNREWYVAVRGNQSITIQHFDGRRGTMTPIKSPPMKSGMTVKLMWQEGALHTFQYDRNGQLEHYRHNELLAHWSNVEVADIAYEQSAVVATKDGTLQKLDVGTVQPLWTPTAESKKLVPEKMALAGQQTVYFIDYFAGDIKRWDPLEGMVTIIDQLEQRRLNPLQLQVTNEHVTREEAESSRNFFILRDNYRPEALAVRGETLIVTYEKGIVVYDTRGQVVSVNDGWTYSFQMIIQQIGIYLGLVAVTVVAILLGRTLYLEVFQRRRNILMKQLAYLLIIATCTFLIVNVVYRIFINEHMGQENKRQLQRLAYSGTKAMNIDDIMSITQARDYGTVPYQQLETDLHDMISYGGVEEQQYYAIVYQLDEHPERHRKIAVASTIDSINIYTPFLMTKEDYEMVTVKQRALFLQERDVEGEWIYVIQPIVRNHQVVAMLEIGRNHTDLAEQQDALFMKLVGVALSIVIAICLSLAVVSYLLLRTIRRLTESTEQMALGNFNVEVTIRTKDEFEDLAHHFNRMAATIRQSFAEMEQLNKAYYRFVPEQLFQLLGTSSVKETHLGTQKQHEGALLYIQVADYFSFVREIDEVGMMQVTNRFISEIGPRIRQYDGFVTQYSSSAVVAFFPHRVDDAHAAAATIVTMLQQINHGQEKPLVLNFMIDYGEVTVGIIGEEERLASTIISPLYDEMVQLAPYAPRLSATILLTDRAYERLTKRTNIRFMGDVLLPVQTEAFPLYDSFGALNEAEKFWRQKQLPLLQQAIDYYRDERFFEARTLLVQLIKENRHDLLLQHYFYAADKALQQHENHVKYITVQ